jgi:hypothetical protein
VRVYRLPESRARHNGENRCPEYPQQANHDLMDAGPASGAGQQPVRHDEMAVAAAIFNKLLKSRAPQLNTQH